ncbi:MAG: hypothetical protein ACOCQG_03775 [Candidatus Nanoarchaeia archaeon]
MRIKEIIMVFCVLFFAVGCVEFEDNSEEEEYQNINEISSFSECVEDGNPVMESYPRQCEAGGKVFVEELSKQEKCENLYEGKWLSEYNECEGINESVCLELEGSFDDCASACRHDPDSEVCTDVCVPVCSFDENKSDENSGVSSGGDYDDSLSSIDKSLEEKCVDAGGDWLSEHNECEYIDKEFCDKTGGNYYDCESACRHDPGADMCIEVCVPVCTY